MDHAVDALRGGVGTLVAAHVALDELHVAADRRQVLAAAGGEVVEHADGAAAARQLGRYVRADEAAAAGDEHGRHLVNPISVSVRPMLAAPGAPDRRHLGPLYLLRRLPGRLPIPPLPSFPISSVTRVGLAWWLPAASAQSTARACRSPGGPPSTTTSATWWPGAAAEPDGALLLPHPAAARPSG